MIGFLVLVSLLPTISLCGGCNYSSNTVHCQGITQDDFLMELLRNKDLIFDLDEIVIEDSDFSNIQPFVDISNVLYPEQVNIHSLTIRRSRVDTVSNDTFGAFKNLKELNLSQNNITNLVWLTGLPYCYACNLDLSYNNISEVEFNDLKQMSSIWLSNNEISILKPASDQTNFDFIDLSHNKLVSFSEFESNVNIRSLDLSYNYLQKLALESDKDLLKIEGYGNSNISYIGNSNSYSVSNFYSSFIPNNTLSIYYIFKLNWFDTDMPVLDSNKLPSISSAGTIDFSNNNLTSIPQNYFQSVQASVFNLSFNNFDVLSNRVFGVNSAITTIDLSVSNIRKISNEFFINCCSSSSIFVNLSGNAIEKLDGLCTRIPQLNILDLSSNRITNLSQISLSNCSYLNSYNISNNFISHIHPGAFQDVPIKTLDLNENNLLFINKLTFRYLQSVLKNINLRKNNISTVGSKSFGDFDNLEIIDLSENKIRNIESYAFSNLEYIDTINLSNNAIELLQSYTFYNISVQNIDLKNNPIHYIKEKAFSNLNNLESLNLSNSAITLLESDVFFSLPAIRTIDLSNNYIYFLSSYTFKNLPVKNIYLYGNKIETISQNAFYNLQNLKYLDLSKLGISIIDTYAFNNMTSLVEVNLKNNNIEGIGKYTFHIVNIGTLLLNSISNPVILDNTVEINTLIIQLTGTVEEQFISSIFLKNLTIIDSHIELLKNNCFVDLPLLTSLNLINTTIDVSEDYVFSGLTSLTYLDASQIFKNKTLLKEYTFEDMRNLQVLIISNSALDTIENNAFVGLSNLKELHLQGNKLTVVNFNFPNNVKYLDLSCNFIANIHSQTFRSLENLAINQSKIQTLSIETLNLSRNKLKVVNLTIITNGLPNLITLNLSSSSIKILQTSKLGTPNTVQYLDLSNNFIANFDSHTFRLFKALVELDLHTNQLVTIGYESFNCTKNLQTLRLDNNKITSLSDGVMDGLENLSFLNISDNKKLFFRSNLVPFQTLRTLDTFYVDNTYLNRFTIDVKTFRKTFPRLSKIGINDNQLSCNDLLKIMVYFDDCNIDYRPYNPKINVNNLNGITCT
ncbi:protein artichoke-like [Diabrotica virgifera virgifera]|uniref:Chaoptin-like n=1 Tax=Diabrotica virgifera virgifera TaxID=50390 RepID=A0ABM5JME5_DIAVI|nr:protein artichoke-like [Diabrotica virgifera virgifera]